MIDIGNAYNIFLKIIDVMLLAVGNRQWFVVQPLVRIRSFQTYQLNSFTTNLTITMIFLIF